MKYKLDELQSASEAMIKLLQDRQEGIATWWMFLRQASDRLHDALPPRTKTVMYDDGVERPVL